MANPKVAPTRRAAVSEQIVEFLLTELSNYSQASCAKQIMNDASAEDNNNNQGNTNSSNIVSTHIDPEESMTVAAEMAAAKLERIGAAVGFRLTERLAESKTWSSISTQDAAAAVAAQQLEAVKFLCKEVWMELFHKQIDKLQTNHRGVFVLKDLNLKWLTRFPAGSENSRVAAIRLLAFPCGIIRGALANLGIPAVVSCDFLADGQNMAACSFNIKVK